MDAGLASSLLQNRAALLRFLHARGAGPAAEDLLQELWVKASAGTGEPISDPLAYLYRMAANVVLDHRRAEIRRARREQIAAEGEVVLSDLASGERVAMSRDELRQVGATLAGLGERTETIFRRFRVEGVSQRQIAEDLGISLSAVEKHLQRAYLALLALRRRIDAG